MAKTRATPRTNYVPVRLTDGEYIKLDQLSQSTRLTRSEVLRHLLSEQPALKPAPPPRSLFDNKALAELAKIGSNINQIARELNRLDRQAVTAVEFQQLDRALMQVAGLVFIGAEKASQLAAEGLTDFMPYVRIPPAMGPRKQ